MVELLSQMEGSDNSIEPNIDHSMVSNEHSLVSSTNETMVTSEQSVAGQTDGTDDVASEGLIVKDNNPPAEMCQETETREDAPEAEKVKCDDSAELDNLNEEEVHVKELKSILKRRGQYTMRKVNVDFDLIPKRIPFDETKDYTVEIKIIDKEPVKIKSYAALFAAKKAEAEAEEAAAAEAEAALKRAEEVQKREALKRASKAKHVKKGDGGEGGDKEEHRLEEKSKTEESVSDQQPTQLFEDHPMVEQVEDSIREIREEFNQEGTPAMLSDVPVQANANTDEISGLLENEGETQEISKIEDTLHEVVDEEVSEHLSKDTQVHPLHLEEKLRISMDECYTEDEIPSTEMELSERQKLAEEVLMTAASIVEDILAETPVRLKAISFDDDSVIQIDVSLCSSTDRSDAGREYLQNEDRTESSIEELPNEDKTDSINEDLRIMDRSDSATDDLQQSDEISNECAEELQQSELNNELTEELQHNAISAPEIVKHEAGNAVLVPTDEQRTKMNNIVVSQKLNESLKKASPEIIQSAVRVLVEIEKVTLAVVKNLEPLVP